MMKTIVTMQLAATAFILAGATARVARADGAPPVAESAPSPASSSTDGAPSRWMARVQAGVRWMAPSDGQRLLSDDGYDSRRKFVLSGDFTWYVVPALGLGVWGECSLRKVTPDAGGPTLSESFYAGGIEAPVRIDRNRWREVLLVPRLGYGWSFMDFGGHVPAVPALAYGADIAFLLPRAHLSFSAGYLNGPTSRPAVAGRDYNFGGFALSFGGMIDG
jgi:hypothetical protein